MADLEYGIIGNCRSAALVSKTGSLDWCCLPDFDSPSIFAKLLDEKRGGHFSINPLGEYKISQQYQGNTNILITHFENELNAFDIIDFMPRYKTEEGNYYISPEIYRLIRPLKGKPRMCFDYNPKLNYAQYETTQEFSADSIKYFTVEGRYESVYLYSDVDMGIIVEKLPHQLSGDCFFLISYNQKLFRVDFGKAFLEYERTLVYWMNWSSRTRGFAKFQKEIHRSALVLKLLSFQNTGAVIAAPTTSIPETINETRNWDYRYCWIRDSSLVIKTLLKIGHINSAKSFLDFILRIVPGKNGNIQIMYGIRGEKNLEETILNHLGGFEDSPPVRIGNSAYIQKQHDIYGILTDAIYLSFLKFPSTVDTAEELWTLVRSIVAIIKNNWHKPDKGIWEIRGEDKHFVFSKVLAWVTLDRGIKIASLLNRNSYLSEWSQVKETIRQDILKNGWNQDLQAFVQSYGSTSLDAANLLMMDYGFIEPNDPMYVSTVLKTKEQLSREGMMFRYLNEDDFGQPKNSFILCTFWLINSLYRIGYQKDAHDLFVNMLKYGNHLGLFSEHIEIVSKRLLGNFPQGYSHLGIIQSALLLNGIDHDIEPAPLTYIRP